MVNVKPISPCGLSTQSLPTASISRKYGKLLSAQAQSNLRFSVFKPVVSLRVTTVVSHSILPGSGQPAMRLSGSGLRRRATRSMSQSNVVLIFTRMSWRSTPTGQPHCSVGLTRIEALRLTGDSSATKNVAFWLPIWQVLWTRSVGTASTSGRGLVSTASAGLTRAQRASVRSSWRMVTFRRWVAWTNNEG